MMARDGKLDVALLGGRGMAIGAVPMSDGIRARWGGAGDLLLFADDQFTLVSTTPTLTLTYLPLPVSVTVYLNGIAQLEGTDWTRSGQDVTVDAAMGAVVGDVLEARYCYQRTDPLPDRDLQTGTFFDDFNRADGPVGNGWTTVTGNLEIDTNTLVNGSPGTEGVIVRDTGTTEVDITATFLAGEPGAGIIFRYQDASNYLIWIIGSGSGSFYEVAGGVFSSVGGVGGGGAGVYRVTSAAGSSTVDFFEGGSPVGSYTSSLYPSETLVGLRGETALATAFIVDDFLTVTA